MDNQDKGNINLAIVVPCYNEEAMLSPIKGETVPSNRGGGIPQPLCNLPDDALASNKPKTNLFTREVDSLSFNANVNIHYIFVDDGSSDNTLSCLEELSESRDDISYISFSRNFGKESAIYAGLEKAIALNSDYIATMDVDLQDPPSLLPEMLELVMSGEFDSVATRRVTRKGEPPIRSFFARMFYRIINRISDTEIVDGSRDYRMMTRQMVEAIVSMKEVNRFSKGLFSWVGFRTKWLEYENIERKAGETKWSFWKLFKYSIDGIVSFSTVPLSIASITGVITCIASFIYLAIVLIKTLAFGEKVAGYPSIMCVLLFLGGVQLICLGILGQYLAKAYLEIKNRPIYIIRKEK